MGKRSLLMLAMCGLLTFSTVAGALQVNVYAARGAVNTDGSSGSNSGNTNSADLTDPNEDTSSDTTDEPADLTDPNEDTSTDNSSSKTKDDSTTSNKNKNKKTDSGSTSDTTTDSSSKSTTTKKKTTTSSGSGSTASGKDAKGNTLLMTEKQRKARFWSKTNPKRGTKPANVINRPAAYGFTYADFGTFNSYNSDNGFGGSPIYLLGTIMEIEKVSENVNYYQAVLLVNDCDGYQWYMRTDIAKSQYDLFKNTYTGKAGYIYGIYSGYSGVTNRPMMDVTIIHVTGGVPVNLNIYK